MNVTTLWTRLEKIMTKELFVKRLQLIQNFRSQQETIGKFMEKFIDGWAIVTFGDYLVDEILEMIIEDMEIEDKELISWWLYEDVEKIIYFNKVEIDVETPEKLYDYIIWNRSNNIK